jgi:tRNA pseudouridine55 synthase
MSGINDSLCGIICVNKPEGFTSFDVIAKMRGILRVKRLGHAGTLDPLATGVLPVFVGKATKACDIIPNHDKSYEAEFCLGIVTDTEDTSGKILSQREFCGVTEDAIEDALTGLRGDIMQTPPMYSAVTVNGQRLYDLARKGIVVEREPRHVTVYSLKLLCYDSVMGRGKLSISCSKGTYIRTIISDMGEKLGCGGAMSSLVRTSACGFELSDCVTLEDLQELADKDESAEKYLCPIDRVFSEYEKVTLNQHQEKLYKNGVKLDIDRMSYKFMDNEKYRIYGCDGLFIGTAKANLKTGELAVDKNFI